MKAVDVEKILGDEVFLNSVLQTRQNNAFRKAGVNKLMNPLIDFAPALHDIHHEVKELLLVLTDPDSNKVL